MQKYVRPYSIWACMPYSAHNFAKYQNFPMKSTSLDSYTIDLYYNLSNL